MLPLTSSDHFTCLCNDLNDTAKGQLLSKEALPVTSRCMAPGSTSMMFLMTLLEPVEQGNVLNGVCHANRSGCESVEHDRRIEYAISAVLHLDSNRLA